MFKDIPIFLSPGEESPRGSTAPTRCSKAHISGPWEVEDPRGSRICVICMFLSVQPWISWLYTYIRIYVYIYICVCVCLSIYVIIYPSINLSIPRFIMVYLFTFNFAWILQRLDAFQGMITQLRPVGPAGTPMTPPPGLPRAAWKVDGFGKKSPCNFLYFPTINHQGL